VDRVLVIEDDDRIAQFVSRALSDDGYGVERAARGHGGSYMDLSFREFLLLQHVMRRAGQPCSRGELLSDVWGLTFDPGSNVVDVCVRRLRMKLDRPDRIETVRNVGYRLTVE
jgi:DNA-binding response OmpR family regulator